MSKNTLIQKVDHIELEFKEEQPIEACVKEAQGIVHAHGVPVHFNHQGSKYVPVSYTHLTLPTILLV